jgi:sugar phosphate isomerase/epimerase
MPMHAAIRVSYPERGTYDWYEALAAYAELGCVEVAFYRPDPFLAEVQVDRVVAPFASLPLKATSVHMAQARLTEFETFVQVLRKTIPIAQGLGCSLIVVHPTNARLAEVSPRIAAVVDPLLAQAGVTLCWETFSGQRRFLPGIEGIAAFCRGREYHAACYDTSHLHKPQAGVLADISAYGDCIRCFHLSNRGPEGGRQHLPLRHPEGALNFEEILAGTARSGYSGPVTLEYLPEFHDQLLRDGLWAAEVLRRCR